MFVKRIEGKKKRKEYLQDVVNNHRKSENVLWEIFACRYHEIFSFRKKRKEWTNGVIVNG